MPNTLVPSILVLGATGQVGKAWLSLLGLQGGGLSHSQFDLADPSGFSSLLKQLNPCAVVNAAAYTSVDLAESNPALAFKINGESPGILAHECAQLHIPFIHYSTDYIFSGEGNRPWLEEDPAEPLSAYGRSKLEGEKRILDAGGSHLIFRTSWVYDSTGKNFLTMMLQLGKEKEALRVVADQWGAPTYAPHLAKASLQALLAALHMPAFPSGIYHLCHRGETSRNLFATAIFDLARKKGIPLRIETVEPIPTSSYPTPAKRPLNCRLNLEKVKRILGVELPGLANRAQRMYGAHPMKVTDLPLSGLKLVDLDVFKDGRGFFVEVFNQLKFQKAGLQTLFVQDNHTRSTPGVLRGLHFQTQPQQGKLIGAIRGRVWDVSVDIRVNSPTFGKHFTIELNGEDGKLLWIPRGFAHGFCVLGEEPADLIYKVDGLYNPKSEGGISWDDPDLNIPWPLQNPILSPRDETLLPFSDYRRNPRF